MVASWIPGSQRTELGPADLLREFLLRTEHLERAEVARLAEVGEATLYRWECGRFRNLQGKARQRMHLFLAGREIAAHGS